MTLSIITALLLLCDRRNCTNPTQKIMTKLQHAWLSSNQHHIFSRVLLSSPKACIMPFHVAMHKHKRSILGSSDIQDARLWCFFQNATSFCSCDCVARLPTIAPTLSYKSILWQLNKSWEAWVVCSNQGCKVATWLQVVIIMSEVRWCDGDVQAQRYVSDEHVWNVVFLFREHSLSWTRLTQHMMIRQQQHNDDD